MSIQIQNLTKTFGDFTALDKVNLLVPSGELVALLGPSGSGKTTLLRIIAGLDIPTAGAILFHGEDTTSQKIRERGVGFVFQHYALFRHMTVFENVAFGLRVKPRAARPSREKIKAKVGELLQLVQLDHLGDRFPNQLSGGQRQRVALARALAVEPKVLLLDEPFGALDAQVRKELRRWLRRLHDEIHITSVFVTHDQEEALEVADRVAILNQGRIEQEGTPEQVYSAPANSFVYNFLGNVNLFHGRLHKGETHIHGVGANGSAHSDGSNSQLLFVRPHLLEIDHHAADGKSFPAKVQHINPAGPLVKVELATAEGDPIQVELSHQRYHELQLSKHAEVFVWPKEVQVFSDDYVI